MSFFLLGMPMRDNLIFTKRLLMQLRQLSQLRAVAVLMLSPLQVSH